MRFVLAFLLLLPSFALTQEVVLGLSKDEIGITAFFDGSEILIYGAVKHEQAIDVENPLGVVITVASPRAPVMVRRKEKRYGIWVNVDAVEVDLAPHFYAVASTDSFSNTVSTVEDLRHSISIPEVIRSVGAPMNVEDPGAFSDGLIRIRTNEGLYQTLENAVQLQDQTLFSTSIKLPANLTEGDYSARIFLTRNGEVISQYETQIDVRKVGLERWLYNLAHQQAVLYGLLSLSIAIFAGWAASAVFRVLRG